ncbi:hypothetical protein LCGC14_2542800, partial [marine sediment metagenome]
MVIPQARELTEAEKQKGFKQIVFVRPAPPTLGKGVVEEVDPKTGKLTGATFSPSDIGQFGPSGRRGKGFLFVSVPARAEVTASIRRRETIQEQKALAQKEAEFESKRIAEGKVKAKDVVLTQRGSRVILQRILREQAQKKLRERLRFPTKEQRVRETLFRQELLAAGLETRRQVQESLLEKLPTGEEITRIVSGQAIPIGFIPPEQALLDIRLAREGIKLPEELTIGQRFGIFIRDVTPESVFKGFIDISETLGEDVLTLAKAPPPTTPQFSIALATDKELREAAVRVSVIGATAGALTLLPPAAKLGAGLLFTGLETKRFIERPTGEQLGRTLFVVGV